MTSYVKYNPTFKTQFTLDFTGKIIVDFFAGGGGASTGLEMGLNRGVYVAVNHNPKSIAMHKANHPHTKHYVQDVFAADPVEICDGFPVGWFHASPDCTHHSQAAGGQPRKKEIRDLAWVVLKFAGKVKPDVISLENVKQMLKWGPLIAKRDKATGRVITLEKIMVNGKLVNRVAEPEEIVPRNLQFLIPDPKKAGKTWNRFVKELEQLGYVVEWRSNIIAADFGAGTKRSRLFMVARCDGNPIKWPEQYFSQNPVGKQKKWIPTADCIDWSDLGKSIFNRPKGPLADATLRRLAKGLKRFVIDAENPYFVKSSTPFVCRDFNTSIGHCITEPLATTTASYNGHSQLVCPILAPFITEFANASQQRNWSIDQPLSTICAQVKGGHHGLVTAKLSKHDYDGALRVAAFLINYYGNGDARDIRAPMDTMTTKDRLALVTVWIREEPYVIVDICLRMFKPPEYYKAQGFPDSYIIDPIFEGKRLSKKDQVYMVGNSVSPLPMAAIAKANDPFELKAS